MSGSGGFYKYRCKYFYTEGCPNWVWVNNAVCAECLSKNRDAEPDIPAAVVAYRPNRDLLVPQVQDGVLQYVLMEFVPTGEPGNYWTLREKVTQPPAPSSIPTTSAQPRPVQQAYVMF